MLTDSTDATLALNEILVEAMNAEDAVNDGRTNAALTSLDRIRELLATL